MFNGVPYTKHMNDIKQINQCYDAIHIITMIFNKTWIYTKIGVIIMNVLSIIYVFWYIAYFKMVQYIKSLKSFNV